MADTEPTDGELWKREGRRSRSITSELNTGKERIGRTIIATFIAALGPLGFGYCLGYSSSALEDLASASPAVRLTDQQGSWFSVSLIGVFFSSVLFFSLPRSRFSTVKQRSCGLRDDAKNGCEGGYVSFGPY